MKNKMLLLFVIVLLAFAGVVGCSGTAKDQPGSNEKGQAESSSPSQKAAFPLTIKDSTGKEVKIEKQPQKIVSIMPSTTEIAFALGLGNKIIGVSNYDDYPKEAAAKQKVGDLNVSIEKVVSLEPDVVLADTGNGKAVDNLRKAGIPVIATEAKTLNDVYGTIEMIGKATGTLDKANNVIEKMKEDVKQVEEKVKSVPADKKPKVWVEVDPTLYTAGKGTFIDDMIVMAGGENIASDVDGWKQLSEEKIIERNPDIIIDTYGYYDKEAAKKIKARTKWKDVNAIKNGNVFDVDSNMVTRPGPRITEGLKQVAGCLHPELFKK